MRVRIVHVTTRVSGARAERVETLDVESLHIGRGTDNDLCLNGLAISLAHATVTMRGDGVWISVAESGPSQIAKILLVNRRSKESARLVEGDRVRIGHFELVILPPEASEDLALRVEAIEGGKPEREALDARTQLRVEEGWLTRRRLSWAIVGLLVALFLVLPLLSDNQSSWNSGPISNKHAFIQDDCRRCHGAFEAVANEGCLECHFAIEPHTPTDAAVPRLADARCAECHIEHNGDESLADLGETLCSGCHADIPAVSPGSTLAAATDFGLAHPEFQVHVVTEAGSGRPTVATVDEAPEERSGLAFNHWRHVGQRVPMPDGSKRNLACDACHRLERDGSTMQPIQFERDCQTCHRLTFDPSLPDRDAVHANPVRMREELSELYSNQVLRGTVTDETAPRKVRFRRPGRAVTKKEQTIVLAWVEKQVTRATNHLMGAKGECARCHEILPEAASDGGPSVAPIEIASHWMPQSEFRHDTHGPFPCRDCHPRAAVYDPEDAAGEPRPTWSLATSRPYALFTPTELAELGGAEAPSKQAMDVLIPGIAKCRSCHGGERARPPHVASPCGMCHPFHRAELAAGFSPIAPTGAAIDSLHPRPLANLRGSSFE